MNIIFREEDKAAVLAALFNASRPLGMGMLHFKERNMEPAEAEELLKKYSSFDYLEGRVMKVRFDGSGILNARLYDRDNGEGAALAALQAAGLDCRAT